MYVCMGVSFKVKYIEIQNAHQKLTESKKENISKDREIPQIKKMMEIDSRSNISKLILKIISFELFFVSYEH